MGPKYLDALTELGGGYDTLDAVIARLDVGLFVDHVEKGCIYASPEVLRMWEMPWEAFQGFGWARLVDPGDVERLRTAIERYEIEKTTIEVEYTIVTDAGTRRRISVVGHAVLDDEGNQLGSVMTGREVTAERAVRERATQQQKLEVIGRLAGRVAHDFNNVLMPIMFSASMLRSETLSEHGREAVETIEASAQHAAAITRQLLSLSRQQVQERQMVVVDRELEDKARLLEQLAGERVAFEMSLMASGLQVSLAPHELLQIVLNLVVNARDAQVAQGGQGRIDVATVAEDAELVLCVTDDGPGIPEALRARIYEPFFTTKSADRGTGLGLFTVKELISGAGGTITIDDAHRGGTRFVVRLPSLNVAPSTGTRLDVPDEAIPPQRVLIVDDDAALRQTLAFVLALRGHEVQISAGQERALQLLGRSHIDVLVTDVLLQDGNGPELVAAARARKLQMKVIYMSGFTGEELDAEELKRPDTVFLAKPFHPNRLNGALAEVLANDGDSAAVPPETTPL